ncbi:MAG: acyltransferase, partial [Deltaproteobacteria bacterium]|nr:acyltransferase [Deltaproteobacteria bacterium]
MNAKSPALAYRPDIDGLRAFAVLAVVGFHAFPATLKGGFIGVDVFFVISGYLISGILLNDLQQGTFSLWNFYSRRIRRIFPALLVVLAAVLIFGWFALFPDEYLALGMHVFGGAAFSANFLLWREAGYWDVAAKAKPLLHLWSLGIEEQFYVVFPLLLFLCAKKHFRIATIVICLCILSFLDNLYCMPDPTVNFYNPLARAWELLSGAALCALMRHPSANGCYLKLDALTAWIIYKKEQENDGRSLGLVLAVLGVILLGCALLVVRESRPFPGLQALLPVLGTTLLIAAGSSNPVSRHLFANRLAVFTGLVSYPFYLWHWALISYAFIINGGLDASTRLVRVGLVITSFVLAVLTYFLVEKPIRFGVWARQGKVYALIAGMLVMGTLGAVVRHEQGFPARSAVKSAVEALSHTRWPETTPYVGAKACRKRFANHYPNCLLAEDAAHTVAILGDSMANAHFPGFPEGSRARA